MAKKTTTNTAKKTAKKSPRKKVRIALIGAGVRAASTHYPALSDIAQADVVAACDLDENRLHKVCNQFGIRGRYSNYREMI